MVDLVKLEELEARLVEPHSITNGDIDSIIAYVEFSNGVRHEAAAALSSARAEIERLREALTPFAREARSWTFGPESDNTELGVSKYNKTDAFCTFTFGDLRRAAARIRILEQQLSTAREALEPFASAFQQARLSYAKRYHNVPLEHGFSIFDKMPDKWLMDREIFNMGDFRRAAAAIRSLGEKDGQK